MKKLILFLLIGALLILPLSGCFADNKQNEGTTPNSTTENTTPEETTPNTLEEIFGDNEKMFTAETFVECGYFSSSLSLNFQMNDGKVYINDILYDKISHVDNVNIVYSDSLWWGVEENNRSTAILTEIQNSESCYMLETENDENFGKKIAVYLIEDIYYFVNFYDNGNVMRVFYANSIEEVQ